MQNLITDGSEEQQNIRSKRAKKTRASGNPGAVPEPDQRLDNDQSEISESPVIPTGFLSPSVKEYLELGKSIPGKISSFNNKFQFNKKKVYFVIAGADGGKRWKVLQSQ